MIKSRFFRSMFREREFGGQDVEVSPEISFMEAVQGCTKIVSFQTAVTCESCGGAGIPPGTKPETCRACRGSGMTFMQNGSFRLQSTCSQCGGSGRTVKEQMTMMLYKFIEVGVQILMAINLVIFMLLSR
ncbi:unnamed protein product [Musa hybrid cultivar]